MPEPRVRVAGLKGLLLVVVPFILFIVAEIAALIWVAQTIGWWTLALLVSTTVLGALLLQREWSKAWAGLSESLRTGQLPPGRTADAALVMLGGVLLIMPGFLTDVVGLLLLLPFTRPLVRSAIGWWAGRAIQRATPTHPGGSDGVIKGEVITDDDSPGPGRIIPGIVAPESPQERE